LKVVAKARAVFTVALLIVVGMVVAGCAGDQGSQQQAEQGSQAQAQRQGGGGGDDTLQKIRDAGEVVVGVKYDQPPFGFVPEGENQPTGFDVEIATAVAEKIGVEPRFEQVTSQNRIPNLETGKIDMIVATMTHTRTRDETIDFSLTYFEDGQRLLVPNDSDIQSVDDLAGRTVATVQGSTSETNVAEAAPEAEILTYQGYPDALQAMLRGEADAVTTDGGILVGLADTAQEAGEEVKLVGDRFSDEPYGIGVRQGDAAMRDEVNFALQEMVEDGTYEEIYRKYFSEDEFPDFTPEVFPVGS